ncbi:TPA: hypothetical protein I4D82_09195 [Enterobacter cloacae]|nr:hypothetical protein [Enterobacter cloacae]
MAEKYYSILTNRGKELEAQSSATGKPVIIKDFVVGDGNGQPVKPDPAQTKLVREVYRNAISALQVSPDQANQFIAQLVLATGVGGFVVREVGLLTDAGELYSVANCAAIEKPENGVSVNLQYRLAVSETASIELKVATGDGLFLRQDANLSDVKDAALSRKSLGLKSAAVLDAVTSMTDITAGRVPVVGWMGLGGVAPRSKTAASNNYDSIPAGLQSGFWTHTVSGDPFAYSFALQQDGGGVKNTRHLIIPAGTNDKIALRWDDGSTFRYQYFYTDKNKPTPADIDAVDKKGDEMSGVLKVGAEVQSTSANSFRMAYGDYGAFWRNDGNNLYLMLTNKGDAFGNYNPLRPLRVSLDTGAVVSESPLTVTDTVTASKEITAGYTGAFAFAEQYRTKAPFFNSYTTAGTSEYHPALKQLATINGKNSWAFSMGSLVSGDVLSWHLQMKGSGGNDINYRWDVEGNFTAPGRIYPGNFSNFDDRYIQKDGCSIAGFASGDATRPYMRHAASSLVVYLAKVGDSYTKSESDNGYAAKTNVYTKAESDGRFQPKGSYGAPNSASRAANGWWQCGSTGIIEQWCQGATMTSEATQTITFPKAFPNACLHVEVGTLNVNNSNDTEGMFQLVSKTNTGCVVRANRAYGSIGQVAALIKAVGY